MITLGTGVGSGIIIDEKVVCGPDGFAGELGHTNVIRENGRLCGCGRKGCFDAYASATGVVRSAKKILSVNQKDSLFRTIQFDSITSKDVYDAAVNGDEIACEVFRFTRKILGEVFSDFITFSAPEAIILFGGLSKAGSLNMNPIIENVEKIVLGLWNGKVEVMFSELKEADAAVLGAAALGWGFYI